MDSTSIVAIDVTMIGSVLILSAYLYAINHSTQGTIAMIIELSTCGSVSACNDNGSELEGELLSDLHDCCSSGDCEDSCLYVINQHKPEFRIVKMIDGEYQNVIASPEDKQAICETIYFESESDFSDESLAELYIVWEAAANLN